MKIKILGTGCNSCKLLEENVRTAIRELGIDAEVIKVDDFMDIMAFHVAKTPGLVIDDEVITTGRLLSVTEVKEILTKNQ
jgi:small redox-active disulfide protein 2